MTSSTRRSTIKRAPAAAHPSVAERIARGKAARAEVPRSSHAAFEPSPHRTDPIALLQRQAATRAPELVPIRYLGKGDSFDRALLGFSKAYAHQNEQDYEMLQAVPAAVSSGRTAAPR